MHLVAGAIALVCSVSPAANQEGKRLDIRELPSDLKAAMAEYTNRTGVVVSTRAAREILQLRSNGTSTGTLQAMVHKFPVLRIKVQPEPPMDYTIFVNEEKFAPKKPNEILVPRGPTIVRVTRDNARPCNWTGDVQDDQLINCTFDN
jgi:hypothetical protein